MAKHRLINCDFINARSFKGNLSNKAKLLYLSMFMVADDRGFVDTTQDIIDALKLNDDNFTKSESMCLLENTYDTALQELIGSGLLYEFKDNHNNKVHLIRHWFYHNKYVKGLWTNYRTFLDMVELKNSEYVLKPLKEINNIKESNINENNVNESVEEPYQEQEPPKPKTIDDFTQEELEKMSEDEVRALLPI